MVGAGVFYGASVSEAHHLVGEHAYVVGGGNSAGQAVMHLSRYARRVTLVVRGPSLDRMSKYLRDELDATANVAVRLATEVIGGGGEQRLERLILLDRESGAEEEVSAGALFLMLGGVPLTAWLPEEIERDRGGYLLTGTDLVRTVAWSIAGRLTVRPRCSRPACRACSPRVTCGTDRAIALPRRSGTAQW